MMHDPDDYPDFGQQIIETGSVNAAWSLFLTAVVLGLVVALRVPAS